MPDDSDTVTCSGDKEIILKATREEHFIQQESSVKLEEDFLGQIMQARSGRGWHIENAKRKNSKTC